MTKSRSHTSPFLFFFLCLPYGITGGFITVLLPFILVRQGFSVAETAAVVAIGVSASMWRFLWAPVIDLTFSPKKWYLIGIATTALALLVLCYIPLHHQHRTLIATITFIAHVASTIIRIPNSSLQVHTVKENCKGRCSGWDQAGNLGGTGLAGGLGIWLTSTHSYQWAVIVLIILIVACSFALFFTASFSIAAQGSVVKEFQLGIKDFWKQLGIPIFLFTALMLCMPAGAGAASNLWSAIAKDWQAGVNTVALVTGTLSGIVTIAGSIFGGWLGDKLGCWWNFFISTLAMGMVTVIMSIAPLHESSYVVGVLAYAFPLGMNWAATMNVILDVVKGRMAATKVAILISIANIPPTYMTALEGWVHDAYNIRTMLVTETVMGTASAIIGIFVLAWIRKKETVVALPVDAVA